MLGHAHTDTNAQAVKKTDVINQMFFSMWKAVDTLVQQHKDPSLGPPI